MACSAVKFRKGNGKLEGQEVKIFAVCLRELPRGDIANVRDDKELLKSLLTGRSGWRTAGKHEKSIFLPAINKTLFTSVRLLSAVTQQLRGFPAADTKKEERVILLVWLVVNAHFNYFPLKWKSRPVDRKSLNIWYKIEPLTCLLISLVFSFMSL